jgi:hypothetical protein
MEQTGVSEMELHETEMMMMNQLWGWRKRYMMTLKKRLIYVKEIDGGKAEIIPLPFNFNFMFLCIIFDENQFPMQCVFKQTECVQKISALTKVKLNIYFLFISFS